MLNGDGLRSVLWASGCEAHCKNCFNPETWNFDDGEEYTIEVQNEFVLSAEPDYVSGITIVGGEPLHPKNIKRVEDTLRQFKMQFPNKTVWLYTGYDWEDVCKSPEQKQVVSDFVDVLVDGRFVEELKDEKLHWRGSSNQRVIDVQKSIQKNDIVLHCN